MARFVSARRILSPFLARSSTASRLEPLIPVETDNQLRTPPIPTTHCPRILLPSPIPPGTTDLSDGFNIELMDPDLWRVSFGIAQARCGSDLSPPPSPASPIETKNGASNSSPIDEEFPDFDQIENLRFHKKLFYKLDKGSREFEENNVIFHLRKSSKKAKEKLTRANSKKAIKNLENPSANPAKQKEKASAQERVRPLAIEKAGDVATMVECKKVRTPTFNQLTDPYHLPFCLDIFITKGSARACIVHRVTSKVVAVAHSISKDMKFDLTSRRDPAACAAVGRVLAQRAIEDDIHNLVYTPRKGDKIEGKLQIVLQSIINHGVDVKVKLKQKKPVKVAERAPLLLNNDNILVVQIDKCSCLSSSLCWKETPKVTGTKQCWT